jgi:alpha-tubulin suppressor-like RCC1 family protein
MKISTLLLCLPPSIGGISIHRQLNSTDDDIITGTGPTRPSDGFDQPERPTGTSSTTNNNDNITSEGVDNNSTDDESFLPADDEWFLLPSSFSVRVFASGNSEDWGVPENTTAIDTMNGTAAQSTDVPVVVDVENIIEVAAGQVHSVLLTEDGILLTGGLVEGGLGLGREFSEGFEPVTEVYSSVSDTEANVFNGDSFGDKNSTSSSKATTTPPKFTKVYASQYYTIALDENGNVWSTGSNSNGQLCLGDDLDRDRFEMVNPDFYSSGSEETVVTTPPPEGVFDERSGSRLLPPSTFEMVEYTSAEYVEATAPPRAAFVTSRISLDETTNGTKIVDVALGERHTLLVREDGAVFACGWNQYGQLGLNSTSSSVLSPTQVMLNKPVVDVSAGRGSSYLLSENQTVYVMGTNYYGQLCLGDTEDRITPTFMDPFVKDDGLDGSMAEVQSITAGKSSFYMLLSDGQILGCGENTHGQLGLSDTNSTSVDVPTLLSLQDTISVFSSPVSHSAYFVQRDGTVHAVG